jgi:hypothetical protein
MGKVGQAAVVGLLVLGALPLLADEQQKKKGPDKPKGQGQTSIGQLVQAGEVTGRLLRIGGGGSFTLQVVQASVQPPGPKGKGRPRVKQEAKDYQLQAADDVVVRVLERPYKFDDKGKPIPWTPEELKELKGPDARLPGYHSEFDSLKPGQFVTVAFGSRFLLRDKDGKERAESSAKGRDRVTLIVVVGQGKRPPDQPAKTKKK